MIKNEITKRFLSTIILIPTVLFFIIKGSFLFNFFVLIIFLITVYEWHKMAKNKPYNVLGYIFLLFSFYSVYFVRHSLEENSLFIFLFILLICISTDIGGYVFGKIFKGPKLTRISPKKTYAGVVGGYFLSIIFANILVNFSKLFTENYINFGRDEFVFVLIISTVSQIGDIIISFFKRSSKIKDTGKLIPGHGGILDRIDGMIFAFPFFYFLNLLINLL
ncbi:phosphatidate cytidylyltransferase [Pelagibacterales bacterium SAG-MED46]|nr:phosphatidate cytidylyltransferase [Pelagibacterales bacterium SAG-MED46]